ncbi:efflux RND transporter permease subunit, partial [Kaarinaea lacus]
LEVTPPDDMPLQQALTVIRDKIQPEIEPLLPLDGEVNYSGTADKLDTALGHMIGTFALAIAILYLLMSALFRSFKDSWLVLLSIPLATVGGVVALRLTDWWSRTINPLFDVQPSIQPMDLLTMIGFIILLGLVVNNAILLVHQTRQAEREGLSRRDAVAQAVEMRLRPILMSTLTSLFGMLPLFLSGIEPVASFINWVGVHTGWVIFDVAGTELYRGLAAVIVGGMAISTVFTLVLLPSLLRIGESKNLGRTVAV